MGGGAEGTIRDLARESVLINLEFKPRGTKRTIEQILTERNIQEESLRTLCQEEADRMVKKRFLYIKNRETYIFSRDSRGRYSWQPAPIKDVIKYHLRRLLN